MKSVLFIIWRVISRYFEFLMKNVKHRYEGIKSFNPSILYDYIKSNYLEAYFIPLPKFSYLALLFLNL